MRVCPRCGFETSAAVCPHDGATTVTVSTAVATYANGTVVDGRYRIEEVLGIGGFGAVYKCMQLKMDQVVAVKILKNEHIKSEEHVKRFAREAQAASKLSHPNTIRIFDFGSHTDDALFLAMEYLEGETLAQRLDREHRLGSEQVVHILTQICHSLTEAHINGIIHRDLKPENIMLLNVAGDSSFVKVLDFGIAAKLADADSTEEKLTEMGMIMGTPTYMSPEQAHGKPLDARCDIYALGVLMYEALTGKVPFEGDKPMTVLVKHINDPAVPPRELAPDADITRALEKVVLRCLEKEPVLRPQSCAELANMLKKALERPDGGLLKGRPEAADSGIDQDVAMTEPQAEIATSTSDPFVTQAVAPSQRPSTAYEAGNPSRTPLWLGLGALAVVGSAAVALALLVPSGTDMPAEKPAPAPARTVIQVDDPKRAAETAKLVAEQTAKAVRLAAAKAAAEAAARVEAADKKRREAEKKRADAAAKKPTPDTKAGAVKPTARKHTKPTPKPATKPEVKPAVKVTPKPIAKPIRKPKAPTKEDFRLLP